MINNSFSSRYCSLLGVGGWSCCGVGVLSCHSLKQCVGALPQVDSLLKHHKYGTQSWRVLVTRPSSANIKCGYSLGGVAEQGCFIWK